MSHLARDAWVEIYSSGLHVVSNHSRISQEMRELKSTTNTPDQRPSSSHLARDAWVEICRSVMGLFTIRRISQEMRELKCDYQWVDPWFKVSHLARDAWVEMCYIGIYGLWAGSHLARDAWVEIVYNLTYWHGVHVASRKRCVSWNYLQFNPLT